MSSKRKLPQNLEGKIKKKKKSKQCDNAVKAKGRHYTVSVALPSSILENAQSPELRTYLAGQVARACVIYNVDEVVIFNETVNSHEKRGVFKGATKASEPSVLFANILQYLECPQYLRKHFFPIHKDLKYAGLLNPLDCPHHMRMDDIASYREGVTLDRPIKEGDGSYVNAGMRKEIKIDKHLTPGIRVTVRMEPHDLDTIEKSKYLKGSVVSPSTPREKNGLYWGYHVRLANSFKAVFTEGPYSDGYDLTIGTSERGDVIDNLKLTSFNHVLIVFGGVKGLEASLDSDEGIRETDVELLFDHYINTCPNQGSRTIRTEEAILVTLSALRPKLSEIT